MLNRSASHRMSRSVLKGLPCKLGIKRLSPSILYVYASDFFCLDDTEAIKRQVITRSIDLSLHAAQVYPSVGDDRCSYTPRMDGQSSFIIEMCILAHRIRISEILPWGRNLILSYSCYLTQDVK